MQAGRDGGSDLARALIQPDEELGREVADAMTTYDTSFFRDAALFHVLRTAILPALAAAREKQRSIRIWCAAASTGQEPYSLAMMLKEMKDKLNGWRVEIVGTDISVDVLEKAKAGVYSQFEVQRGLPIQLLLKHFTQTGDCWQLSPEIRAMVQFRPFNLLNDFGTLGTFDVVFCRNVLIYFDQDYKVAVLDRLVRQVERDGYLVLGAAETVVGLTDQFKPYPERRGLYVPNAKPVSVSTPRLVAAGGAR